MTITTDVENYPGFADVVQGPWLMEQMEEQARHVGTEMIGDLITEVDLSRQPFRCSGDSGNSYAADALIIATGAQARWLGLASEATFTGHGVSACATCDGFFFPRQRGSPSSAAATQRSRKRSSSPTTRARLRWSIAATR